MTLTGSSVPSLPLSSTGGNPANVSETSVTALSAEFVAGLNDFSQLVQKHWLPPKSEMEPSKCEESDDKLRRLQNIVLPDSWRHNILKVLWTPDEIAAKVEEMARIICRDYKGKKVLVVGLLSGAVVFACDLLRHFNVEYELDFISVASYHGTSSTGSVKLKKDVSIDPTDRHVLIVEDLIDSGITLKWLKQHFSSKKIASIRIACLLDKDVPRVHDMQVDYVGFKCPNEFVVGYGLDFNNEYRCMPFIGVLKPEAYA